MLPHRLAVVALLVTACGPEKQSSSDASTTDTGEPTTESTSLAPTTSAGDTSTDTTCPDHPRTDACCCFEDYHPVDPDEPDLGRTVTQSVCGVQPLCPQIRAYCQDLHDPDMPCPGDPSAPEDESALACALQALVDGKPGRIEWTFGDGGFEQTFVYLDLVGDGTVFRQGYHRVDLCFDTNAVQQLTLPPAAYFAGCLKSPDWQTRFPCLRDAPFGAPLATCLDGLPYSGQENSC